MTGSATDRVVLPRPGEHFARGTVVASVWINGDSSHGPLSAMLLVLMTRYPHYYAVVNIQAIRSHTDWITREPLYTFSNIVSAVEFYKNNGGDCG